MRSIATPALVAAALLLSGCAHNPLMPAPSVVADGNINLFEFVIPEWQDNEATVFIASARTVSGKTEPSRYYTNDRSREVRLGLATVEIGAGMSWEELTRESIAAERSQTPDVRLIAYEEFGPLWTTAWPSDFNFHRDWEAPGIDREPANQFVEAIDAMLDRSRRRQITIYVHGFNTKFGGNVEITSEFWHMSGRDGVLMSFDWPSRGSVFSYQVDKANADFAIRQFRRFLEFLGSETSASRINIIAHSAGNPIVVEALRQLSLIHYDLDDDEARRRTKIGCVVLAAPDMDFDQAVSAAVDGCGRVTQSIAMYASRRDKALGLSADIFGDVRLGRSIGKLSDAERAAIIDGAGQFIDVTHAQRRKSTFLGHSYYHENPWVSSDMLLFLRLGATPEERGLVLDYDTGFLVFPDDYEEQLPEIIANLRAKYGTFDVSE